MNFRPPKPIFRQIAEHIIEQIISDYWNPGERMPSVRDLASEIEVNPNTIVRTYALLGAQGIIHTQRGVGYFLNKNAPALARAYLKSEFIKNELPHLIHMLELLDLKPNELNNFKDEKKKK